MNKISYRFILRNGIVTKDLQQYIYLYCNLNGKTKNFAVGYSVLAKYWDEGKQRAKPGCPDYSIINAKLSTIQNLVNNIIVKASLDGRLIIMPDFENLFRAKTTSPDLVEWMELDLKDFSGKYAKETIHTYKAQLSKLKDFNSHILFTDITPAWWYRYEQFMTERGNCAHTRHKCFTHLKTFINKAVESGIIEKNPLKLVKVKTGKGNRVYLTKEELRAVIDKYEQLHGGYVKNALRVFLFACYTGLRYTDIKLLCWGNIRNGTIEIKFHKTSKFDILPLNTKAVELLPVKCENKAKVFRVPANQKINDYLKQGIKLAGIDKNISFHCARHTFATLLLEASGNIAVVSKLLGHSNLATTQIYAKVLESEKQKAVMLMDGF